MATDIIVKHRVTDFKTFKPGFDALVRVFAQQTGAQGHHVHHELGDPNHVIVTVLGVSDPDKARSLFASQDFQAEMGKIGVCSAPDITFGARVEDVRY
jgi:hypothetical protein